jgi:hypothetical protein
MLGMVTPQVVGLITFNFCIITCSALVVSWEIAALFYFILFFSRNFAVADAKYSAGFRSSHTASIE